MLVATFVVRNSLQLQLFRAITDSAYFTALGGSARWLWLDPALAARFEASDSLVLGESGALVGTIGGPRRWRRRRVALQKLTRSLEAEFEATRPSVVVMANDRPFAEQAVIAAARRVGIPTVLIQDGFVPTWKELGFGDRIRFAGSFALWRLGIRIVGAPRPGFGSTDYCGVMGSHWRRHVRSRSGRHETVKVIGQPLFDAVIKEAGGRDEDSTRPDGRLQVLFLATDFRSGFNDGAAAAAQLDDIRVLHGLLKESFGGGFELEVRPHPLEDRSGFSSLEPLDNLRLESSGSLERAVLRSDLVVSNITSACLTGIAARIPTLLFTTHFQRGRYHRLLGMYPCASATDAAAALSYLKRLDNAFERAQWIAENASSAAEYLYTDPDQTAAELAVFLLHEAAGRFSETAPRVPAAAPGDH